MKLFYWREGDREVDFILTFGDKKVAIEVKSGRETLRHSGIDAFTKQFAPDRILLVGQSGIPLDLFLSTPPQTLFS